jgi:TPR repeat protein
MSMCCLGDMHRLGAGTAQSDHDAYRWYFTAMTAGYSKCEERFKNAKKLLDKAEREAAERDAKEWLGALQLRMSAPRPPTGR